MPGHEKPYIKPTDAEVDARINQVYTLLLRGMSQKDIVNHLHDTSDWDCTKRTIRNYVYRAETILANEAKAIDRRAELKKAAARYEHLFNRCLQADDLRGAMQMQDRLVSLLGLHINTALEIDWQTELKDATPSEVSAAILQLIDGSKRNDAS